MDLEYINDIKEYLKYNILNPIIEKIVIFSSSVGFESKIKIDSKKIKYFEVDINLFEMMKYGKKNTKNFVIYSTPFIRFGNDLKKVLTFDSTKVFVDENCYYIFNKSLNIKNERNIEDILIGEKKGISLNIQKSGYYIRGYQYNSYDWRISKTFKSDSKTKGEAKRLRDEVNRLREEAKKSNEEAKKLSKDILTEDQVLNFLGTDKMKKLENKVFENNLISNTETFERVGPKRLDVIIVSVNYNDFLIISLMNNIKIFDNITVVTSSSDFLCQKICKKFNVNCIVTDNMYEDGAVFNKGKAVNEGIKSILDPDYILLLDADILVMEKIDIDSLDKDVLYTSDRYIIPDYTSYKKYVSGIIQKDKFIQEMNFGFGFFQLFNYSKFKRFPETSDDASTSDILFRDMFHDKRSIDKEVLHIGEDSNWRGRKSKTFLNYDDFNYILEKKYDLPKKTFKICTFYYNPNKDVRREENFLKFLAQFECYQKNLLIGVVDYGDEINIPDYLKENLFVIKGNKKASIWYKELILNRMIDVIDTDYIIWMDSDLIYENLDWLKDINSVVRGKDFVQLFEKINYLDENGNVLESHKSIISSGSNDIDRLLGEGYKPGGAWIGKTSILKHVKFFEKMYVGGGDTIFLYGLFNINNGFTLKKVAEGSKQIKNDAVKWINNFGRYKVGFLSENINHLYHGDLKDRNYNDRYKKLSNLVIPNTMLVSVIIVNYNCVNLLERAIDSVINQTYKNIEIIILDNASTDDSIIVLEKYKNVKNLNVFLNNKNLGPYWAKNSILDKINGDYITMLDSDDMDFPDKIEKQINMFEKKTMMVSCSYQRENESPSFGYPSMMWKKEVFEKIGYYDSTKFGADSEFFDRFIKVYGVESHIHINEVLQSGPRRIDGLTMLFPEKSKIRAQYISSYQKWHEIEGNLYIDFPLIYREFKIPKQMTITEDISYFEIKKLENENDILPVIMCTWKRVDGFEKVVNQLNKQTFKRFKLFVWNNNTELKKEFEYVLELAEFEYEIFHSLDNIGGFGRFYYAKKLRRKPGLMDYCVFIDDDQTFGNELLSTFYNEREYNVIKSQWGWRFSGFDYYSNRIAASVGEEIHYAGTGGMIADMRVFEDDELFLCEKEYWYVEDLWLSYFANKKHGYKLRKSGAIVKNGDDEHSLYRRVINIKTPMLKYLINDKGWNILNPVL
jgi:glycosyltransferase involved in cell wall biosynthesis